MAEQRQRICWNCGGIVPGKIQFCPSCNSLQKEMAEEMLAEPRTRGTVNMMQFVLGVVVIIAVLIIAGMAWSNRPKPVVGGNGTGPAKDAVAQPAQSGQSPNEITPSQHVRVPGDEDN